MADRPKSTKSCKKWAIWKICCCEEAHFKWSCWCQRRHRSWHNQSSHDLHSQAHTSHPNHLWRSFHQCRPCDLDSENSVWRSQFLSCNPSLTWGDQDRFWPCLEVQEHISSRYRCHWVRDRPRIGLCSLHKSCNRLELNPWSFAGHCHNVHFSHECVVHWTKQKKYSQRARPRFRSLSSR